MADAYAMSFSCPNYSGLLYNKGNTRTPFLTAISGRRKYSDHVEFALGQEYSTATGAQPSISENASLTAPDSTVVTRTQTTNVAQIYQESVGVSYAHESNMGTLSGINVAGQTANPISELDFQVAAKMAKIAQDIEFTFMQGAYNRATSDTTVNKTRGIFTAVPGDNTIAAGDKPLTYWMVAEAMKLVQDAGGDASNLVLWVNSVQRLQLNADCAINNLTIVPRVREVNGIAIDELVTPMGVIGVYTGNYVPEGKAGLFNLSVCSPVELLVPGKGNFFYEELAKTGAGTKGQIFGQIGLDYGPAWYHGAISGLSTKFTAPESGIHVYVDSQTTPAA